MRRRQQGAALIEMSLTLSIFLLFVIGIFEFSLLMMNVSRASEVTRELARIAIVNDPICDIYGGSCPGAVAALVCPGGAPVQLTLAEAGVDCTTAADSTSCRLLTRAAAYVPTIAASQIEISYACSTAGAVDRPQVVPLVSVALRDVSYTMILPELLGLDDGTVALPAFATVRTGEALFTLRSL